MRKTFTRMLIITMILLTGLSGFCTIAYALDFTDINIDDDSMLCVKKMTDAGIISGYPDATFRPNEKIKRSEAIKIINLTFDFTEKSSELSFTDIKQTDWFYDALATAVQYGYINGYDNNTFRPSDSITREQFCKILCVILGLDTDSAHSEHLIESQLLISDNISDWAKPYVNKIVRMYIMPIEDNNTFRATEDITRLEVCQILANYIVNQNESAAPGGTENSDGGTENNTPDKNDEEEQSEQEIIECIKRVSKILQDVCIPALNSQKQIEICYDIYQNMTAYLNNNSYNYEAAAGITYQKYNSLTEEEQNQLKNVILSNNTLNDLIMLKNKFFPDVSI